MYINHSNLQIEITNITNTLVMTNSKLQAKIDNGQWMDVLEEANDQELWEFNLPLVNEIMDFMKEENIDEEYIAGTPQRIMIDQIGEFFRLMLLLSNKGKMPETKKK